MNIEQCNSEQYTLHHSKAHICTVHCSFSAKGARFIVQCSLTAKSVKFADRWLLLAENAAVAQSVEHFIGNEEVRGSDSRQQLQKYPATIMVRGIISRLQPENAFSIFGLLGTQRS